MSYSYKRPPFETLRGRLAEPRRFIQIVSGPRQVGKTTLARQVAGTLDRAVVFASADDPALKGSGWIQQQWEAARIAAGKGSGAVLFLDEIQKLRGWAESVKALWDTDSANNTSLHVVLLGSSPLLIEQGLTESLAGRFELVRLPHWSFVEMNGAFGWNWPTYAYFGGYPGAAPLVAEEDRWRAYVNDALIETSISRDILLMTRVDKPALLRQVFDLACHYSGQVLSYQKMLGQLQDAGNTVTLAHYLKLLEGAGMVAGLPKYAGQQVRRRASSPKLNVMNTALMAARLGLPFEQARHDPALWGRFVESAVGAHLLNAGAVLGASVYYWRDRGSEVDFVVQWRGGTVALEVKSIPRRSTGKGVAVFKENFSPRRILLVGGDGIPVEEFLSTPLEQWLA